MTTVTESSQACMNGLYGAEHWMSVNYMFQNNCRFPGTGSLYFPTIPKFILGPMVHDDLFLVFVCHLFSIKCNHMHSFFLSDTVCSRAQLPTLFTLHTSRTGETFFLSFQTFTKTQRGSSGSNPLSDLPSLSMHHIRPPLTASNSVSCAWTSS